MRNKANVSQQNKLNTAIKGMADDSNELVDTSQTAATNPIDLSDKMNSKNDDSEKHRRDLILTHKEAEAGSPDDMAACGEEDIGAGLEFLVTRDDHHR